MIKLVVLAIFGLIIGFSNYYLEHFSQWPGRKHKMIKSDSAATEVCGGMMNNDYKIIVVLIHSQFNVCVMLWPKDNTFLGVETENLN